MNQDTIADGVDASLADLCALHLQREEALLGSASRIVRAVLAAFKAQGLEAFRGALQGQAEVATLAREMNARRRHFHDEAASRLNATQPGTTKKTTLRHVLAVLSDDERARLAPAVARVRCLAQELADLNYRVSVHLRVHLSAYRRILSDLTGTTPSSGRYGPAGTAESVDYRPLLLFHG